jgi:hypothetical protein
MKVDVTFTKCRPAWEKIEYMQGSVEIITIHEI